MRKFATTLLAAAAIFSSPLAVPQPAQAADVSNDTTVSAPAPAPVPRVHAFDCRGTTGSMGCGPGWFWRDGWRGWSCYPC
jgi:hypothetical protein